MLIVIPGALPPSPWPPSWLLLPERAPALHVWLQAGAARAEPYDLRAHGCTAFEAWQLRRAGHRPEAGLPLGAGLGPLLMQDQPQDGEPVWLAELAHLALGADQAMLADPTRWTCAPRKAPRCTTPCGRCSTAPASRPSRWTRAAGACACPKACGRPPPALAVAGRRLNDWWKQDAETRPWRRLLNEIQMAWHDHPVNEARARGVAPVNALWLYGGARPWRIAPPGQALILTAWTRRNARATGPPGWTRCPPWTRSCAPGPASRACPTPRPNCCCWATTAASPSP